MKLKNSSIKKVSELVNIKSTIEVYSKKAGKKIEVTINPMLTEKERLNRVIGLLNTADDIS